MRGLYFFSRPKSIKTNNDRNLINCSDFFKENHHHLYPVVKDNIQLYSKILINFNLEIEKSELEMETSENDLKKSEA